MADFIIDITIGTNFQEVTLALERSLAQDSFGHAVFTNAIVIVFDIAVFRFNDFSFDLTSSCLLFYFPHL